MKAELTATFTGGVLKPDVQLHLPEQTRVKLTVEALGAATDAAAAWSALHARIQQRPVHGGQHYSREQLHERR